MQLEGLESRRHFSITSSLDAAGTLAVQGDGANDVITVQESGAYLIVSQSPADLNWVPPAPLSTGITIVTGPVIWVPLPGYYPLASVRAISVNGGGRRRRRHGQRRRLRRVRE